MTSAVRAHKYRGTDRGYVHISIPRFAQAPLSKTFAGDGENWSRGGGYGVTAKAILSISSNSRPKAQELERWNGGWSGADAMSLPRVAHIKPWIDLGRLTSLSSCTFSTRFFSCTRKLKVSSQAAPASTAVKLLVSCPSRVSWHDNCTQASSPQHVRPPQTVAVTATPTYRYSPRTTALVTRHGRPRSRRKKRDC